MGSIQSTDLPSNVNSETQPAPLFQVGDQVYVTSIALQYQEYLHKRVRSPRKSSIQASEILDTASLNPNIRRTFPPSAYLPYNARKLGKSGPTQKERLAFFLDEASLARQHQTQVQPQPSTEVYARLHYLNSHHQPAPGPQLVWNVQSAATTSRGSSPVPRQWKAPDPESVATLPPLPAHISPVPPPLPRRWKAPDPMLIATLPPLPPNISLVPPRRQSTQIAISQGSSFPATTSLSPSMSLGSTNPKVSSSSEPSQSSTPSTPSDIPISRTSSHSELSEPPITNPHDLNPSHAIHPYTYDQLFIISKVEQPMHHVSGTITYDSYELFPVSHCSQHNRLILQEMQILKIPKFKVGEYVRDRVLDGNQKIRVFQVLRILRKDFRRPDLVFYRLEDARGGEIEVREDEIVEAGIEMFEMSFLGLEVDVEVDR